MHGRKRSRLTMHACNVTPTLDDRSLDKTNPTSLSTLHSPSSPQLPVHLCTCLAVPNAEWDINPEILPFVLSPLLKQRNSTFLKSMSASQTVMLLTIAMLYVVQKAQGSSTFNVNSYSPPAAPAVFEGPFLTSNDNQVLIAWSNLQNISFVNSTNGSTSISNTPSVLNLGPTDLFSLSVASASVGANAGERAACYIQGGTLNTLEYSSLHGWQSYAPGVLAYGCSITEGPGGDWLIGRFLSFFSMTIKN